MMLGRRRAARTLLAAVAAVLALAFFSPAPHAAGGGKIWHSPKPGGRVKLSTLWTTVWTAGRVR